MKLFLFAAFLKTSLSLFCPSISCTTSLDYPTCAAHYIEEPRYFREFQICTEPGEECDITISNEDVVGNCGAPAISSSVRSPNKIDLDVCFLTTECATKQCIKGICVGLSESDFCENEYQCKAHLFCSNDKICVPRLPTDSQCTHNRECLNDSECIDGRCLNYFSVRTGLRVTENFRTMLSSEALDLSRFCMSGFMLLDTGICEDLVSYGVEPHVCLFDPLGRNACAYKTSNTELIVRVRDTCICSMNEENTAKCQLDSKSKEWQEYKEAKLAVLARGCPYLNKLKCSLVSNEDKNREKLAKAKFEQVEIENYPCLVTVKGSFLTMGLIFLVSIIVM